MRDTETAIWLALCLAASLWGTTGPALGQTVHFQYRPRDGETSILVAKRTRTMEMAGSSRTEESETRARVTTRKTPAGYVMSSKLLSMTVTRDGKPAPFPIGEILTGLEVTYRLDPEGQLLDIEGFEPVLERVRSQFPPAVAQAMAPLLNAEVLMNRERAEWEARVGRFAGKSAEIGDAWMGSEDFELPTGGKVTFHSAVIFEELVDCGGKQCVRLKFLYNSDASALGELIGKVAQDTAQAASRNAPVITLPSPIEVTGEGERVVDPDTMDLQWEKTFRTIRMQADVPGQGRTPMTMRETREYTLETVRD